MLKYGENKTVTFYEILKVSYTRIKRHEEIKSDHISSIHKKGDRKVFSNYRGKIVCNKPSNKNIWYINKMSSRIHPYWETMRFDKG